MITKIVAAVFITAGVMLVLVSGVTAIVGWAMSRLESDEE